MGLDKILVLGGFTLAFAHTASAQIVSQNPRPKIINPEETLVETVKPNAPIGTSGTYIKIPRTAALLFAGFDADGDYIIDRDEVSVGISTAFKRADKDGNGTLSLVELDTWRLAALGFEHATPTNFAFAPNFARTVSPETFRAVLASAAEGLDKDDQGELDGKIAMSDLFKNFTPRRGRKNDGEKSCAFRVREARRETEQRCGSGRRY